MKTYTARFKSPATGASATATIVYQDASWPVEVRWAGANKEFRLRDGSPVSLLASMDRLKETVAHQAEQAGAEFTLTDDGGQAPMRTDEIKG